MRVILVLLLVLPLAARSGPLPEPLPEPLQAAVARDPQGWLRQMTDLVRGYGDAAGVDAAGIARFVAVERAAARARVLGWLAEADFDFDGRVSPQEAAAYATTLSVRGRTAFGALLAGADADGDGLLTADEGAGAALRAADRRMGPGRQAGLAALIALDRDGDGRVGLAELQAALPPAGG
jgi:hypothetical protein